MSLYTNLKQKQLFSSTLEKINKKWFYEWFKQYFNAWNLLVRIVGFIIILFISNLLFFVLRQEALNSNLHTPQFNTGMGFSFGSEWPVWSVYFVKTLISCLFLILALIMNKWYLYLCFFVISVNSFLNVIDKGIVDYFNGINYYNAVVDYIYWPAFNFTNNIADILIVSFVIVSIIMIIVYIILMIKKDKNNETNSSNQG